ncbi:MAG: tail fiber protein [Phycisphaerales bacterium]
MAGPSHRTSRTSHRSTSWRERTTEAYGAYPCDGRLIQIAQNSALFSLLGTYYGGNGTSTFAIPDLRGRVAIGTNTAGFPGPGLSPHFNGEYTGERLVTLFPGNLPGHVHSASDYVPPFTGPRGGNLAYQNMQPSLPMMYCIALGGVYPTNSVNDDAGYLGEIMLFAGNFAPAGYVPCDGRSLAVSENEALFMLMGTTFGSDGPGTFKVPDLRGRTPVGPSSTLPIGLAFGTEQTLMSSGQMPSHVHSLPSCAADVGVQGGLPGHDGMLDNNDFIAFIQLFFTVDARADLGVQGGLLGHDGAFDNNDFIAFINLFFTGC